MTRATGACSSTPSSHWCRSDIVGNSASCVFSARDTMANGRMVKALGWYDNEWGYANRLVDLVELIAS